MSKSQGQHGRAVGGHRPLRRRRLPLVPLHLQGAVGRLPLLDEAIGEQVRLFLKPLWSTYYFYVLYARANEDALSGRGAPGGRARALVRGPGSERISTAGCSRAPRRPRSSSPSASTPTTRPPPGRAIAELLDELSNWYVRRSRRRFWDGDAAAFRTLRTCLLTLAKLLAPFCPFIADEIYDNLDGTLASVHLCDFPVGEALPAARRASSRRRWRSRARPCASASARARRRRSRSASRSRRRWSSPPARARGDRTARRDRARGAERQAACASCGAPRSLGSYEVKPNYPALGPLFGKDMPLVADAIAALDPARVAAAVRDGADAGRDRGRWPRPHAHRRGRVAQHAGARGLQRRARGHARGGARPRDRRRAAPRGPLARHRARGAERAAQTPASRWRTGSSSRSTGDPALLDAARSARATTSRARRSRSRFDLGDEMRRRRRLEHREQTEIDGLELEIALRRVDRLLGPAAPDSERRSPSRRSPPLGGGAHPNSYARAALQLGLELSTGRGQAPPPDLPPTTPGRAPARPRASSWGRRPRPS